MTQRWPEKVIIGLTGNVATGKSAVLRMVAERGALALDADKVVHEILDNDPSMQAAIAVAFGDHLRRGDGSIDRAALGAIVFNDAQALHDLEQLLHPAVRVEIKRRIDASDAKVVIIEAIKLLEGELAELCDEIWVTRCPRRLQLQRLIICRGLDEETAAERIDAQNPQEAKVARADVVIDTDGAMDHTREQVERAWQRVEELMADSEETAPVAGTKEAKAERQRGQGDAQDKAQPAKEARPAANDADVLVRRARPSDIPSILLLLQRATGGKEKRTRSQMLESFSERSYLIGQIGADVVTIVGWNTDSTTAVCIEQVYAHPTQAVTVAGPALLAEIERSAQELICEVVLAFLPPGGPSEVAELLKKAGYEQMTPQEMPRAWRLTVQERRPQGSVIMAKVMRDVRVG